MKNSCETQHFAIGEHELVKVLLELLGSSCSTFWREPSLDPIPTGDFAQP